MLYRTGFFPDQWDPYAVLISVLITVALLVVGAFSFRRLERPLLKEL
ncbi:ABC-type polysaccharide/polyol phosphate export permease [Microbacterium sp. SORGH_AS 505]|nr:ABC-type polysaccharide/polyol phosphate export permease [Microbacterium sp. SORGH_AS_0505]